MPKKDKSKAAKALLKKEEGDKTAVSVGQMRAAEEEQRMGRRGIDEGKKKKKIPSDPVEHIRTLYGTGKANERVKKARKRLYDRYVEQGKLEPIPPSAREKIFAGEKVEVLKWGKKGEEPYRKQYGYDYPHGQAESAEDAHVRRLHKEGDKGDKGLLTGFLGDVQEQGEDLQDWRLRSPQSASEQDDFHSELVAWRKKHKKPLSSRY